MKKFFIFEERQFGDIETVFGLLQQLCYEDFGKTRVFRGDPRKIISMRPETGKDYSQPLTKK